MKKKHKSLHAFLVTLIVGMLLPNIFTLTGNTLLDKLTFKIVLSTIFSVSTFAVGGLYAFKIINSRISGGRARILIYLILVILVFSSAMPFLVAFAQAVQWIIYVVGSFVIICVICLIFMSISKSVSSKKQPDPSRQLSLDTVKVKSESETHNTHKKSDPSKYRNINHEVIKTSSKGKSNTLEFHKDNKTSNLFTLYELWEKRDLTKKCLTVTNDENPDLEWVKIYKPPYGNKKFYGYVKMNNAQATVNGEIYFAERAIWRETE